MNDLIIWSPGMTLENIEKRIILQAFHFYRNNKTATANSLGIAIRTLDNKLEKYEDESREQLKRDEEQRIKDEYFLSRQRGVIPAINCSEDERAQQKARQQGKVLPLTDAWLRLESDSETSAQHPLPVSQSKKVQGMLPEQAAPSGARRTR